MLLLAFPTSIFGLLFDSRCLREVVNLHAQGLKRDCCNLPGPPTPFL
jgi:hypothetical protein